MVVIKMEVVDDCVSLKINSFNQNFNIDFKTRSKTRLNNSWVGSIDPDQLRVLDVEFFNNWETPKSSFCS